MISRTKLRMLLRPKKNEWAGDGRKMGYLSPFLFSFNHLGFPKWSNREKKKKKRHIDTQRYVSTFTFGKFTWVTYLSQRITVKYPLLSNMLTANLIKIVICESFCQLLSSKSKLSLNAK